MTNIYQKSNSPLRTRKIAKSTQLCQKLCNELLSQEILQNSQTINVLEPVIRMSRVDITNIFHNSIWFPYLVWADTSRIS